MGGNNRYHPQKEIELTVLQLNVYGSFFAK